jgi:phage terminase small subunit
MQNLQIEFKRNNKPIIPSFTRNKPAKKQRRNDMSLRRQAFINFMSAYETSTWSNASKAAAAAGYSSKTAGVIACHLMQDPRVSQAIEEKKKKLMAKFDVSPERTINELASIAYANKADFYDDEGRLKNIRNLPRHVTAAISGVEVEMRLDDLGHPAVIQKIKLHDKTKALELLGKHFKLFTEKFEFEPGDNQLLYDEKARQTRQFLLASLAGETTEEDEE